MLLQPFKFPSVAVFALRVWHAHKPPSIFLGGLGPRRTVISHVLLVIGVASFVPQQARGLKGEIRAKGNAGESSLSHWEKKMQSKGFQRSIVTLQDSDGVERG